MSFLENSGDIILQTVLTDLGRKRLAEGTFKIVKFAFGDDEINYGLYNGNHVSGSLFYDLEILQTPIFEPSCESSIASRSRLLTITNPNLLYLPVLKLNTVEPNTKPTAVSDVLGSGSHVLIVDQDTLKDTNVVLSSVGYMDGFNGSAPKGRGLRIDQGLDTSELSAQFAIEADLKESQYTVEMDNRFMRMFDVNGGQKLPAQPAYIDDDQIASYFVSQNIGEFVQNSELGPLTDGTVGSDIGAAESIAGPRGTKLKFGLLSSVNLRTSDYLFTLLGNSITTGGSTFYYIDSVVRVSGVNTGYRIDVPVRIVKKS